MRVSEFMSDFFDRARQDKDGNYLITEQPERSAAVRLNIEELALFSVIDLISSAAAMCEWRFYRDDARIRDPDWFRFNFSPNSDQNGAEFKRLLFARALRFNEALVFQAGDEFYIADSFTRQKNGFAPAIFSGISYDGSALGRTLTERDVLYFSVSAGGQAAALQQSIRGLYSAAMAEAWDKYQHSGGRSGILKIGNSARGRATFEQDFEKLMNNRFKRFFEAKNAVLPLFDGYDYIAQNSSSVQKSTSEVSDIGALIQQAQVSACNPFHVPPSLLRGEVTNLSDAVNAFLSFAVRPILSAVEAEFNRKRFGAEGLRQGYRMRISTVGIQSVDILAQAANAEKLVQNRIYNANGIREIFGDEPIPEKWAEEYVLTKNVETERQQTAAPAERSGE